jgi:tRNA (cytidine/uridine-2'-O-)-methyltransferase
MFDIVLFQPEIPPNTGNLIRLAANTGCRLHLVEPLGFDLSDKQVARAGLDYHDMACVQVHASWAAVQAALPNRRWFAFTTKGSSGYADRAFQPDDVLLFGPESRGLPRRSAPPAAAHAGRVAQHEPVQCCQRGCVRGLAAE